MTREEINGHKVIAWALTGDQDFPEVVLCQSSAGALGAGEHLYVVWPVTNEWITGNGMYRETFEAALETFSARAADPT